MRKNYYLIDVVTKARCMGFTEEEINLAVLEGLVRYGEIVEQLRKAENWNKEKLIYKKY